MEQISSPAQKYVSLAAKSAIFLTLVASKTLLATTIGDNIAHLTLQIVGLFREDIFPYST